MTSQPNQSDPITDAEVRHVARLARIALDEDDVRHFTNHLSSVLNHAAELDQLDLSAVEPMHHPYPLVNVMRPDTVAGQLDRDTVLAQAPDAIDGQFGVPSVLSDEP